MAIPFFFPVLLFCTLFSTCYSISISSQPILHAVETLSLSGFSSMALTLQQTLVPESSSATIFAPYDAAFLKYGQLSVSLLQYHFSPLRYSPEQLKSLQFGTKIPTLFQNHSLIVTNAAYGGNISLNGVNIMEFPVFDDGSLIVYGVDRFLDPSFQISPSSGSVSYYTEEFDGFSYDKPSDFSKSKGSSAMGSESYKFKASGGSSADKPLNWFRSRVPSVTGSGAYNFKGSEGVSFDKPSDLSAVGSGSCMLPTSHAFQSGSDSFHDAADQLRSRRYFLMASFLDMQLIDVQDQMKFTVFAPSDDALSQHLGNTTQFVSFFRRHVLPCKLSWSDLALLRERTELQTFNKGSTVNFTGSGDILVVNGNPVVFPDLYHGESLVVHGLYDPIGSEVVHSDRTGGSFSKLRGNDEGTSPYSSPDC